MNLFKKWIREYNSFKKGDRHVILILGFLVLITFLFAIIIRYIDLFPPEDYSQYREIIKDFETNPKNEVSAIEKLFYFDPNTISKDKLDTLKLPEKIKHNLLNYRKAGGVFDEADDVRKIYGMNDSIYNEISVYIKIVHPPKSNLDFGSERHSTKKKDFEQNPNYYSNIDYKRSSALQNSDNESPENIVLPTLIELNSADSTDLMELNGIGSSFAKRIIKYRDLLGGFYNKKQLLEIYNFPIETFQKIEPYVYADSITIRKIRLNFSEFKDLIHHPYLNKTQIGAILSFRQKNGSYIEIDQLRKENLLDEQTFSKIKPYLTCD